MKEKQIGKNEIQKKDSREFWKKQKRLFLFLTVLALTGASQMTAFAAGANGVIQSGFNAVYQIIAAIVSSIGSLFLLWGVFEWAQSLNTQDGGAQSAAFKRIGSGIVATVAPQIIPLINGGGGTP
ncbi:hypothetical protein DW667_06355 [Coprococcus sp. AM25-15LB]|nr:hypothetical protein DW667_06355 [Coprococcus sp. AM25-15LB]RJW05609.1 hypothetical protein DW686_13265 [Coprococcus sp. AM25-4LB]